MEKYVPSSDGSKIHYKDTGKGNLTLVFIHGWLGNAEWWIHQRNFMADKHRIIQIDLGGHGKSDRPRKFWSSKQYVDDIKAVIDELNVSKVILVGHSMSGAYALEASLHIPQVSAIILVDTLKDLDQIFTSEQAEILLYSNYRKDFRSAVETILLQHLFATSTPLSIKQQLQNEFLQNSSELAIHSIEPLYKMDLQSIAKQITIPVRSINSDATPTSATNNRKYLKDYTYETIHGTGHYPMLENPGFFNELLEKLIRGLTAAE